MSQIHLKSSNSQNRSIPLAMKNCCTLWKYPVIKQLILCNLFLFILGTSHGQFNKIKEIYQEGEDFFIEEDYKEAIYYFLQVIDKGYINPNLEFKVGVCYLNIPGEEYKAVAHLEEASKHITQKYKLNNISERQAPLHSLFYLGNAYRIDNQLDKALAVYDKFVNSPHYEGNYNLNIVETEIRACERAKLIQDSPIKVDWERLPDIINTPNTDSNPIVSVNENCIAYLTALKLYNAVYFARKVNGEWQTPENINPQILSDGDMVPAALSANGDELYLIKTSDTNKDIYFSRFTDGKWTIAKPLNKNINTIRDEVSASISADGKTLYFASNRKESRGGYDLFKSLKNANGEWGKAESLGKTINTREDEMSPSISPDGKNLYFSSKEHYNMGGFDIFHSQLGKDGKWEVPQNVGYPLNTTNDNNGFVIINNEGVGYISKSTKPGLGNEDIYRLLIQSTFTPKTPIEQPKK